ncbi:hypothetical protein WDU94_014532 [Cyamophila willieti]
MGDEIEKPCLGEVSIPEKLLKREQERQMAMDKRQELRGDREGDGFSDTFNKNYNKIKTIISEMEERTIIDDKEKLIEKFADVSKQLLLLNHTIIDAKIFLTSYDMKTYNNKLQELTEQANALEAKLLPRKKFGFKKSDKVKPSSGEGDKSYGTVKEVQNRDDVDFVKKTSWMRMHTSVNTSVYLHVTSRPIIENCKGIGFAPVVDIDSEFFLMSGLDANKNHWKEVDDFNWLSVEEKSPNWHVILENDRKLLKF